MLPGDAERGGVLFAITKMERGRARIRDDAPGSVSRYNVTGARWKRRERGAITPGNGREARRATVL